MTTTTGAPVAGSTGSAGIGGGNVGVGAGVGSVVGPGGFGLGGGGERRGGGAGSPVKESALQRETSLDEGQDGGGEGVNAGSTRLGEGMPIRGAGP